MFRDAQNITAANQADLFAKLSSKIDSLEATATSWFDNKTASIKQRRADLTEAAELSERVASFTDPEDSADLKVLAENLRYQSNELLDLQQEIANEEYSQRVGSTELIFSHLMDESRTAARLDTDWDMFMAIEPREFVANNRVDNEELKIRALAFMDDATSGHGMSRKAKIDLTSEFMARVANINTIPDQNVDPELEENPVADDSALFF